MSTNKHDLAKETAMCCVGPMNRAGTEAAKACMDRAVRDYTPNKSFQVDTNKYSSAGVAAGDVSRSSSYPTGTNNNHSSSNNKVVNINGTQIKFRDDVKIVYVYKSRIVNNRTGKCVLDWYPDPNLTAKRYGYPNGIHDRDPYDYDGEF